MKWSLLILFLSIQVQASPSELLSYTLGQVLDEVVTSRDVVAAHYIDQLLSQRSPIKELKTTDDSFSGHVSDFLQEWVIYLESREFDVAVVTDNEVLKAMIIVKTRGRHHIHWKKLQLTDGELKKFLRRKLQASKFSRFKSESSKIPIMDREAAKYFENNREKFKGASFENSKTKIKESLRENRRKKRLQEWLEILRTKYGVRENL